MSKTGGTPRPARGRPSLPESVVFTCMHCGEPNVVPVYVTGGLVQELVEDCQACCSPNGIRIVLDPETLDATVEVGEP